MSIRLSDAQMVSFTTFVETRMGLSFSPSSEDELERKIAHAAWENGFPGSAEFVDWLTRSPQSKEQLETLASHLTIGETYFWRDKQAFQVLREQVIPELAAHRRGGGKFLRIWSAGCATGEEPYSIAILLKETITDLSEWNVTILATDINPRFINKAVRGIYRDWSFRGTPEWLKQKYFVVEEDGSAAISPSLREMVDFRLLNLAEESYPSLFTNTNAMDLVFCRNVLMYFSPTGMRNVIGRLSRSLATGGWLLVSPAEIPHVQGGPFSVVTLSGVSLLRKQEVPETNRTLQHGIEPAKTFIEQPMVPATRVGIPPIEHRVVEVPACSRQKCLERVADMHRRGLFSEAVKALQGLLSTTPEDGEALALLARTYANLGRLSLAQEWCEKAICADRLSPSRYFLLATILEEQGDHHGAERSFRRALYADPDFVLAHFCLGHQMIRFDRNRDGERHLRIALSLMEAREREEPLPESDGTTVGSLRDMIGGFLGEGGSS